MPVNTCYNKMNKRVRATSHYALDDVSAVNGQLFQTDQVIEADKKGEQTTPILALPLIG